MSSLTITTLVVTIVAVLGASACRTGASAPQTDAPSASVPASTSAQPSDVPAVITALYPLQFAAESVAGTSASVTRLASANAEPHDLELSPQQVAALREADLVVYIPGLMPTLDDAVAQLPAERVLDVSSVVDLRDDVSPDPHVWLDPTALASIGTAVAQRLGTLNPVNASALTAGGARFAQQMDDLDQAWQTGTTDCARRDLFVTHDAYGYLADRYGLNEVSVLGRNPEQEPSAARLADVADLIRARGATTIFAEPAADSTASNPVADTLATATGITTATLDPLEIPPATGDYTAAMRRNLAVVQLALGCTVATSGAR